MIGSRLLFSGYGVSRRLRARRAGLLARDTLLVNDEAHFTPVFAELVNQVKLAVGAEPRWCDRPLKVLRLSATQRRGAIEERFPESLDEDEAASDVFR
jgi:CRISPR-associated endonuclease/helicase Cas3